MVLKHSIFHILIHSLTSCWITLDSFLVSLAVSVLHDIVFSPLAHATIDTRASIVPR